MKKVILIICLMFNIGFAQDTFKEAAINGYFEAEGYSAPGQNRFAAMIAAKTDAQRRLLEIIKGAKVTSATTIENGILTSDIMVSKVNGIVRGARMTAREYDRGSGTAMVRLSIGYKDFLVKAMKDTTFKKAFDKHTVLTEDKFIPKKKVEVLHTYDGLIIDVSDTQMEPAYINRIYSNGKIVFDPTKIPQQVFIQRGYSSYTTNIGKAKAILDGFGSNNPLIIKATSTTKLKSDITISINNANDILSNNLKNNFLESAKVVFVFGNN
jgi:hypothetical protein